MTPEKDDTGLSPFPLTPIPIDKKNRSNLIDRLDRLDKEKKLERSTRSLYLSTNVFEGWKKYCACSGFAHHELNEAALLEYMRNHPLPQVTLSVTQDLVAYAPTVKDRIRNKVIKDKLNATITTLRRIRESGKGNEQDFRRQLQKLALQATNLRRPDPELIELLQEVEKLV